MKLALQTCATVDDFEALLARSNSGGADVSANFGVIDAKGGAATFETGKKGYVRFDAAAANDGAKGLLVRSNYSRVGRERRGVGLPARGARRRAPRPDCRGGEARRAGDPGGGRAGRHEPGDRLDGPRRGAAARLHRRQHLPARHRRGGRPRGAGRRRGAGGGGDVGRPEPPRDRGGRPGLPGRGFGAGVPPAGRDPRRSPRAPSALRARLYPETRGEKKRYMDRRALAAVRAERSPAPRGRGRDASARSRLRGRPGGRGLPPPRRRGPSPKPPPPGRSAPSRPRTRPSRRRPRRPDRGRRGAGENAGMSDAPFERGSPTSSGGT